MTAKETTHITTCPKCSTTTLTATELGLTTRLNLQALTPYTETLAILAGIRTYTIHTIAALQWITPRKPDHQQLITDIANKTHYTETVLAEHTCTTPNPLDTWQPQDRKPHQPTRQQIDERPLF